MYELLSGTLPFTGDSNMVIMSQHLNGTAPRLDRVNPAVTSQVAAIVANCLARNPADRYANMDALIQALDHPEDVDVSVLDSLKNAPPKSSMSLAQMQVIQGIVIAIAILGGLVLLALGLQYLRH
jgi:serine/threonine-protein kinase